MSKEVLKINIFDVLSPLHKIATDGRASAEFEISNHELVIKYRVWKSDQLYQFSNSYSLLQIARLQCGFEHTLLRDFETALDKLS